MTNDRTACLPGHFRARGALHCFRLGDALNKIEGRYRDSVAHQQMLDAGNAEIKETSMHSILVFCVLSF